MANRKLLPGTCARCGEVCVDVSRSMNFNTAIREATSSIRPAGSNDAEDNERTVVQRKRLDRKPLVKLADIDLAF